MAKTLSTKINQRIIVGISALLVTGCSGIVKERSTEAKQAPEAIAESFRQSKNCDKVSCITIQKDSLGKIFLLIASGVTGGSAPQWYDLKPQVVSFERSGKKIGLIGQNYNSIYEEIESLNLLQSFEIISEDEKSITFDWGSGLKSFINQSPYDVDFMRGENDMTESSYSSIPVIDSFIRKIKFDEKNIELEQISKVPSSLLKKSKEDLAIENREETIVMNIQIRAYNLNPEFKPKEFDLTRRVGFFVTKLSRKKFSKDQKNLISKWDLSPSKGPIRVRLSATIPPEYVDAVAEGAYYWNKVFGREVIEVEKGVKSSQANPQHRSIMVRWIDWLDAGAAYAISQSDPLTGEILRAQVFMPSVFTKVGSASLLQFNDKKPVVIGNGAVACDFSKSLSSIEVMAKEATDSQRLRLAKDSIRSTVAHELGHALGLRHNFAGSYSSKVTSKELDEALKTYLSDSQHQGLETSTSIMDYVGGVDNILMAARIKNAPLSYDKMAMDWAYSDNDSMLKESVSQYCTDEDISVANSLKMSIYGCERFDAGKNPLLKKFVDLKQEKENLVNVLFASILGRLYPGDQPEVVNNIDQVLFDTVKWGKADFSAMGFISKFIFQTQINGILSPNFASLNNVKFGAVIASKKGQDNFLKVARKKDLTEIGGYAGLLDGILRDANGRIDLQWFDNQVNTLSSSSYLKKGKTLAGRVYELSEKDQAKIIQFFKELAVYNKKALLGGLVSVLPKFNEAQEIEEGKIAQVTSVLTESLLDQDQADKVAALASELISANSNEALSTLTSKDGHQYIIFKRYFEVLERLDLLKLVSSKGLSFNMEMNKAKLKEDQLKVINDIIGRVSGLQVNGLSGDKRRELVQGLYNQGLIVKELKVWLDEELLVLDGLEK